MTGFKSKRAAALDEDGMYLVHHTAQELTLQEQLDIAIAKWAKAEAKWAKAEAERVKAEAERVKAEAERAKAKAEIDRIKNLMEQQDD